MQKMLNPLYHGTHLILTNFNLTYKKTQISIIICLMIFMKIKVTYSENQTVNITTPSQVYSKFLSTVYR
jgi:hypothetical protein